MRPDSQKLTIIPDDASEFAAVDSVSNEETAQAEGFLSAAELKQLRQEKLATIREAVANGVYDSEELLEKALGRMLQKLEDSAERP